MYNSFDFICNQAEKLKAKYDETNPFKLARQMGINVLYAPMGKSIESCKGFYLTHSRIRTMTINSDLSSEFQRIICSHELGHAVLHNKEAGGQGDRYTIIINGKQSYLFFERSTNLYGNVIGRWFVERKTA